MKLATPDGAVEAAVDPSVDSLIAEMGITPETTMGEAERDPSPSIASQPETPASAQAPQAPTGDQTATPTVTPEDARAKALEGSVPYEYKVGAESKVLEGFHRFPGEGVLVPEDKVPMLEQLAVRAETLDRLSRDAQQQTELFERLSEWTTTGHDGKDQQLTGIQGLIQGRLDAAQDATYRQFVDGFMSNPEKLASLLMYNPEAQKYEFRADTMALANAELANARMRTDSSVRAWLSQRYQAPQAPQAPDYTSVAPGIIQGYAGAESSVLTPQDTAFLGAQMPRYVRPATAADVRLDNRLQVGQQVVDASFKDVVQYTVTQRKEAVTKATAATEASKFNAGQDKGRQGKPIAKAPVRPASPPHNSPPQKADWDSPFASAMAELGIQP